MDIDEKEKLPYKKPVLTLFGEVTNITESGSVSGIEIDFGSDEPQDPETIGPQYTFPL